MTRDLREPRRSFVGAFYLAYRNSSGSLAMFAAIRLASPQYPPVEDHAVCASATIPTPIERVVMSALCRFCCRSQLKTIVLSDSVAVMRFATGAEHDGAAQPRSGAVVLFISSR